MNNEYRYVKVSVGKSHIMHLVDIDSNQFEFEKTLCGLEWYAENSHGDCYCQNCQRILRSLAKKGIYEPE